MTDAFKRTARIAVKEAIVPLTRDQIGRLRVTQTSKSIQDQIEELKVEVKKLGRAVVFDSVLLVGCVVVLAMMVFVLNQGGRL